MRQLTVVLPAYNEAQSLPPLLAAFAETFARIDLPHALIVVNDGSADDTAAVLEAAARTHLWLETVEHPKNRGLGPAIVTGLLAARQHARKDGDVIVCMDADNTHPPDAIPRMLERLDAGADIVIASRYRRGSRQVGVPIHRRLLSLAGRLLFTLRLHLKGVRDYTCGFRAYHARVVRLGFEKYGDRLIERPGFACTDELLVKLAPFCARIDEVPFILRYDRKQGASKLPFWATVKATLALLFRKH